MPRLRLLLWILPTGHGSRGNPAAPGFPLTGGVFDANGSCHVFVMQLENNGTGQQRMAMAFGGSDIGDTGMAIAPNGSNTAYVTGVTNGRTFPVTPGCISPVESLGRAEVPFVTQVDSFESSRPYSAAPHIAVTLGIGNWYVLSRYTYPEGVYVGGNSGRVRSAASFRSCRST